MIIGAKSRLAIECDGDFWHGADQYEADLARQRELERCGWEFFRIRESQFYADMPGVLQKLWETLDELGIRPSDWIDDTDDTDDTDDDEVEAPDDGDQLLGDEAEVVPPVPGDDALESTDAAESAAAPVDQAPDVGGRHRAPSWTTDEADGTNTELTDTGGTTLDAEVIGDGSLAPYRAFDLPLAPVTETPLPVMVANVVRIVETEGPILGHRLHQVYVRAAGGQRVGREIARLLNRAIETAQRQGLIVADNPLNESGIKPKTFRTPDQPSVSPRQLGARSLDMVPPAELAHHLAEVGPADDWLTEEELFRGVLGRLGLKRLTENARAVLSSAMSLVARD